MNDKETVIEDLIRIAVTTPSIRSAVCAYSPTLMTAIDEAAVTGGVEQYEIDRVQESMRVNGGGR